MGKRLFIMGNDPKNLYGYDNNPEVHAKYVRIMQTVAQYALEHGYEEIMTAPTLGAGQLGAKAAYNANAMIRSQGLSNAPIGYHALIQYTNMRNDRWTDSVKSDYDKIMAGAAKVTDVTGKPYDKDSNKAFMDFARGLIDEDTDVLCITNGEEDNTKSASIYLENALKKTCRDVEKQLKSQYSKEGKKVESKLMYLDSKTDSFGIKENRPCPPDPDSKDPDKCRSTMRFPSASDKAYPRVSKELIDSILERNADPQRAGQYSRAELKNTDAIYKKLLESLSLRLEHEQDLLDRGFTKEQIQRFGYKSMPQTKEDVERVIVTLLESGFTPDDLASAPGFAIAEDGCSLSIKTMKDGYFCPAWDTDKNMIYGMQIRNCDKVEAKLYGKYTWFSAGNAGIGFSSGQPAAYYKGDMSFTTPDGVNRTVMLITEGVLKCNLAHLGTGEKAGIVGMAGVYGEKGLYTYDESTDMLTVDEQAMANPELRKLFQGAIVLECFDADFVKNKNVREASARIRNNMVDNYGAYATARMTWADDGKGIDDYVVDCNRDGKNIQFDITKVITHDSDVHVTNDEFGNRCTRHVEIENVNQSPLAGLEMKFDMAEIHQTHKIQQKSAEALAKEAADKAAKAAQPKPEVELPKNYDKKALPGESVEEYKARRDLEHKHEHCRRQDPGYAELIPVAITADTSYVQNGFKMIVRMENEKSLNDLQRCVKSGEISEFASEILGLPETQKPTLLVTPSIKTGGHYACVVSGFDFFTPVKDFAQNKKLRDNAAGAVKGSIQDSFPKDFINITDAVPLASSERDWLIAEYGKNVGTTMFTTAAPSSANGNASLDESLVSQTGMQNGKTDDGITGPQ